MKGKTFWILLLVAGLLVAATLLRFGEKSGSDGLQMGDKLFTDLPVNQVATVIVSDAENKTTLVKGESVWQVEERSGYPADFNELRETVVKLSRLKVGRGFKATPESLTRLTLLAPSDANAAARGQRIVLKDAAGKVLADIILGKTRESEDGGSGGQYLKMADKETVFLVDDGFRFLKTTPAEWLDKEVLNIKGDDVRMVAAYTVGSQTPVYTLTRKEKEEAAELSPVPRGRTADANRIDQVLDALAPLSLDDVRPADGPVSAGSDLPKLVYSLFDGREITIFPASEGEEKYALRVAASQREAPAAPAGGNEAAAADDSSEKKEAEQADAPVVKTARQINESLGPWIFSIKKWQFDSFITQLDSLLEESEPEDDKTS
jgi:hypothetical protein